MRLFVALLLPDNLKTQLSQAQTELKYLGLKGNYTAYDNLHCTLVFIGYVHPEDVYKLEDALSDVVMSPFELTTGQLDCFHKKGGDVWWCSLMANNHLVSLHRQITHALKKHEIMFEQRPFKAHITIARQFKAKRDLQLVLPYIEKTTFMVSSFALMESVRIKGELVYRVVATFD
jgi:RNA 2',3'-cyclic 3'-phosphodiesterase